MKRRLLALCGMACLLVIAAAARADRIDDYVKTEMEKRHIPGVSVAVVKDGKVLKETGYGLANVELSVPAAKDTVFQLASVTKQFTATAILMLVEEGKLSLDDSVTTILTGLPEDWKDVTVRHLLNHTSGIKSYTSIPGFMSNPRKDYLPSEIIKLVSEAKRDFAAGEQFRYNNTGYILLGMIIEKAGGKPYGDFMKERIFAPLGMNASRLNSMKAIIKNRATGYSYQLGALHNGEYVSPSQPYAAGALVSTISDMIKWDAALNAEKLLKRATLEQMWTPTTLKSGKKETYGFGWSVDTYRGRKMIGHGGGIPGFSTQISRFPEDRLTVIVLTNLDGGHADALAKGIAAQVVPALAVAPKPAADPEPQVTQKLKDILAATLEEKLDPNLFTPQMRAALFPDLAKQAAAQLKSLGPLKEFAFLERKSEDGLTVYRYRVVLGSTALIHTAAFDKDGKIAGLLMQPE